MSSRTHTPDPDRLLESGSEALCRGDAAGDRQRAADPLHVLLGNHGDLCMALPALKRWAEAHGRPAALLVSEGCAGLLEGCSYVKATACGTDFHQLWPVLSMLKTDLPQVPVRCLQFYQSGEARVLPSFWHEQMYLAGLLGGGEDEPLEFDQRDAGSEVELCRQVNPGGKPMILVALRGNSSPLDEHTAEVLMDILRHEFAREFLVVDLSAVRAHRLYDLLGLYDEAAALVSIDTVHLHLSKASAVPVFALARDYPKRWHGTPQLARFAWYGRYGEVLDRVDEMIQAMRDGFVGKAKVKREWLAIPRGAYNPSIVVHKGYEMVSYRAHTPDPRGWRTQVFLEGLEIKFPYPVSTCAHEDLRLFQHRGGLWASYVCARGTADDPRCVQGYGELVRTEKFWAVREHFQPCVAGNDWSGMQKNMVCFDHEGRLMAIWENGVVLELRGAEVVRTHESPPAEWGYGEIRGGTGPLFYRGKWLRFFHSRTGDRKRFRYHVGALVMETEPPFATVAVSARPIVSGDESGDPMLPRWKPNCVLPYGALADGDGWKVSVGINDAHGALLFVKEEDLNL